MSSKILETKQDNNKLLETLFLLDSFDKIKTIKNNHDYKSWSPNKNIYLSMDQNGEIKEDVYNKNDLNSYEFILLEYPYEEGNKKLGFLIQKEIINKYTDKEKIILEEIKKYEIYNKEIKNIMGINLKDNYSLRKEDITLPDEIIYNRKYIIEKEKKSNIINLDNNESKLFNNGILNINLNSKESKIKNDNDNNKKDNNANNNNTNINKINNLFQGQEIQKPKYIFPLKGLNNIGSTCYMNATLQCLLHVSELSAYFLNEYPNDRKFLLDKNKNVITQGKIAKSYYNIVHEVCPNEQVLNLYKAKSSINKRKNNQKLSYSSKAFSPKEFKNSLGTYNSQFRNFEANDAKDLILFLLETLHQELNYFGDVVSNANFRPNQYNREMTFNYFMTDYNMHNFSIISNIFYGTYENTTICHKCKKILYNFQKFEFISFPMFNYHKQIFDIYKGFENNEKPQLLKGDNKYYCHYCKGLNEAEIACKIIQPPSKLLINIDYGKNKKYVPSKIEFQEEIDITRYVNFNFGFPIKYRIICVCTHKGSSGRTGHYISYCRHREQNQWFIFNDSDIYTCSSKDIYNGSPYLLLYEKISK